MELNGPQNIDDNFKIAFKSHNEVCYLHPKDIIAIECTGNCLSIWYGPERKKFALTGSLSHIEDILLDKGTFWRINRNVIVSTLKVVHLNKKNRKLTMEGDLQYTIAHRRTRDFYNLLSFYDLT